MKTIRNIIAALVLAAGLFGSATPAEAGTYSRLSYSSRGYAYRTYSYYSHTYRSQRYHVAVYLKTQTRYVYYYNSHNRKYWGRYDCQTGKYQLLPKCQQREMIAEIPESAFPAGGKMPMEGEGSTESLLPPPEPAQMPKAGCK
ncbi:MAG: hypothetical protein R3B84_20790 [Zavarzinella sp.]